MTVIQTVSFLSFALFSIVDLRTRLIPLIEIFFVMTACVAFLEDQMQVPILILAVVWGIFHRIPACLMLPFLFYPPSWPAILIGFGVRKQLIGRADLFAVASIGFLFPFPAVIMSLLGLEFWRRWWVKRGNCGLIPAMPGLFLGLAVYSVSQIGLSHIFFL